MPSDPMKTLYSDNYRALVSLLKAYRDDSKKTQRELAFALGENQSFISRYETGQLRLDFVGYLKKQVGIHFSPQLQATVDCKVFGGFFV